MRNQASSSASDRNILLSDITTNDVSSTKHGFAPKLWASAWSTFVPSPTGFTGVVTVTTASYIQIGKTVLVQCYFTGTSNATTCTFTLPVATKNQIDIPVRVEDNSGFITSVGLLEATAASSTANLYKDLTGAAFTASGTKGLNGASFSYEVA